MSPTQQRVTALQRANEIRFARGRLKKEIGGLPLDEATHVIADALLFPPEWLLGAQAHQVLRWLPGVADARADGLLARVGVRGRRQVGQMTGRQRQELVGVLRGRGYLAGKAAA